MATITRKTEAEFDWSKFDRSALKVGDEIAETLKDGREVVFVVMDNGVMGLRDLLGYHRMNNEWTNKGGWAASEMRRYLNEEVIELLPDELRAIIKPRSIQGNEDMLWLFSEMEIFGEHDWTENDPDRGEQLEYFKNPANRVKVDEGGSAYFWWERSPYADYSASFCGVNSNGYAANSSAGISRGVCFGFYI